jgi:hypothetical protein
VPPPPVAGATAGIELREGLGVADGLALGLTDGLTLGVADALALGVADGLAEVLVLGVAEELAETVTDAEAVPGDSFGSVALGADPEHAASEAVATMGTMAQPATVSFAPNVVRAALVRIFIGSRRTSARRRSVSRSPKGIQSAAHARNGLLITRVLRYAIRTAWGRRREGRRHWRVRSGGV